MSTHRRPRNEGAELYRVMPANAGIQVCSVLADGKHSGYRLEFILSKVERAGHRK
jgi:hypothetical protein